MHRAIILLSAAVIVCLWDGGVAADDDEGGLNEDQVEAGVDFILSVAAFSDPENHNIEAAGESVAALRALTMVAVPPPAGLVAGGVLALAGGLMSLFGADDGPLAEELALR